MATLDVLIAVPTVSPEEADDLRRAAVALARTVELQDARRYPSWARLDHAGHAHRLGFTDDLGAGGFPAYVLLPEEAGEAGQGFPPDLPRPLVWPEGLGWRDRQEITLQAQHAWRIGPGWPLSGCHEGKQWRVAANGQVTSA